MSNTLNITLVQSNIIWQDTRQNLNHLDDLLQKVDNSDLIILPEMFNSGFSMNPKETAMPSNGGKVLEWMKITASKLGAALVGSFAVESNEAYYNRLYFVKPGGEVDYYDKRHLFRMAGEKDHFLNGDNRLIVDYKDWKICPLICYDLRFPVWSRNTYKNHVYAYDLLLYVANWPKPRAKAWQSLLQARSIENLCYTVGVNRVGVDGNEMEYTGDSRLFNYLGDRLDDFNEGKEEVKTITIYKDELLKFRKKFPTGLDADDFQLL